jgi:MFS family permease
MMVERFDFQVHEVAILFIANGLFNMILAPYIGKLIGYFGERKALTLEYIGLTIIFTAYAFVDTLWVAIMLYIIDHAFFAMAIAMKTYFQKIADPADMAPTAGVAFTINHIAAVILPVSFGLLWLYSPSVVFLIGAALALCSLALSQIIPRIPSQNVAFIWEEKGK